MTKSQTEQQVAFNDPQLKEKLFSEQLHFLFKNLIVSVPSSLICALITFTALYRIPHTFLLKFWFISLIVISILRLALAVYYLRDPQATQLRYSLFLLSLVIMAFLWGLVSILLIPEHHPIEQLITVIVLAGITAGGVQSLQASFVACFIYTSLILTPLCVWAYSHNNFSYTIFGFAITFYLLFTLTISWRGYKFLHQTLMLKYENIALAQTVQNEKEFLNTMLDNLKEGIIACDSRGDITVFNAALRKKLNIPLTQPLSNQLLNYFELYSLTDEKHAGPSQLPFFYLLNSDSIKSAEFTMKPKDGHLLNIIINRQPIIKMDGEKVGTVTIVHDVTDLKKSERIKNEFVSVVSHELRTPLTSIQGSLSLLMSNVTGEFSDKAKKLIDIANKNCMRLLLLINDILDIEKLEAGKMNFHLKIISINSIVNEAVSNDRMYGRKYGVTFDIKKLNEDVEVHADPDRLLQVLSNLISNAVKFSPENSVVKINIESYHEFVHIFVTDRGHGIPNEFKSQIFQKFSQADSSDTRKISGTGLGLAISKAIIEKMGGTISFVSEPGNTTFSIHLPIHRHAVKKDSINEIKNEI